MSDRYIVGTRKHDSVIVVEDTDVPFRSADGRIVWKKATGLDVDQDQWTAAERARYHAALAEAHGIAAHRNESEMWHQRVKAAADVYHSKEPRAELERVIREARDHNVPVTVLEELTGWSRPTIYKALDEAATAE